MDPTFTKFIIVYLIALVTFLIIDLVWLGFIARDFYKKQLKGKMSPKPNWQIAMLFYALFVVGLVHFAIFPALVESEYKIAFYNGALYGFFTYMTYDLTNMAVLKNWPKKLTIIDIIWGTFLTLNVSSMTYLIYEILTA